METTVADVDEHTEASQEQENENCPLSDIVESSKLKLSSDLEKVFKLNRWQEDCFMDGGMGMFCVDFTLRFWPISCVDCHKFMLAARSKVFYDMLMEDPLMTYFKIEVIDFKMNKAVPHNMLKFIYTGTIDDVPLDSVSDHLRLAATYKLESMSELVQKKLIDSLKLNPLNSVKYLVTAISDPLLLGLKEKAIIAIVDNLSDLVNLEEWEDLTKSQPSLTTEILRTYFMR